MPRLSGATDVSAINYFLAYFSFLQMVSRSLPGEMEKSKSNRSNSRYTTTNNNNHLSLLALRVHLFSRSRTSKGGPLSVKKAEKKIENFGGTDGDDLE